MSTLLGDARIRVRPDMSGFEHEVVTGAGNAGTAGTNKLKDTVRTGLKSVSAEGGKAGEATGREFTQRSHKEIKNGTTKVATTVREGFGTSLKALSAGFIGLGAIEVFSEFISGARESQRIGRLTEQVIKSTGGAAGLTADQVGSLATAISNKTGVDDEAIQSGQNLLLTFTNVRNEAGKGNDVFTQATGIMTDMSVALGQDMSSSAIQLGKALNDPIKGVTALQRVGVSFTQEQRDQIAVLVKSGKTMDAQKIILAELGKEFGGAAEAASTPMEKLQVQIGNLAENIGGHLLPVIDNIANALMKYVIPALNATIDFLGNVPGPVYALLGALAAGTVAVKLFGAAFDKVKSVDFKKSISGITGFLGGPWGIAFTAATAILGFWISKQIEAKAHVTELAGSLDAQTGAVTENTRQMVAKALQDNGVIETSKKLGLNLGEVTDAATGNSDAMAHLRSILVPLSQQMEFTRDANGQMTYQQTAGAKEAENLLNAMQDQSGAVHDAAVQARDLAAATSSSNSVLNNNSHLTELNSELKTKNTDYNKKLKDGLKLLNDALQSSNNQFLIMRGAENGVFAAMDDLTASIKTNGKSLDVHTAKGRANRQALDQVATAALSYLSAQSDNVKASPKFAGMLNDQRDRLITAAEKFGMSKTAAKKYADQILNVPKTASTKVDTPGLAKAKQDIKNLGVQIQALRSKNLEVVIDSHGNALLHDPSRGHGGMATGGLVRGPGSGTSDSIPKWLSNGEFVVNAKATAAVRPLLEAINAQGMATGGLVSRALHVNTKANMPTDLVGDIIKLIDPSVLGGGPVPGGSGVTRWGPMVQRMLGVVGLPLSLTDNFLRQIGTESGGNPNAIQGNIGDINNRTGDLAKGLLQVIGATFRAFHWPGTSNSPFDPWANMTASGNYVKHRYPNPEAVIGHGHGYSSGTDNASPGWHLTGENGPELVRYRGGESIERELPVPEVTVHVYFGDKELTDIIDYRVDIGHRKLAQAVTRGRR